MFDRTLVRTTLQHEINYRSLSREPTLHLNTIRMLKYKSWNPLQRPVLHQHQFGLRAHFTHEASQAMEAQREKFVVELSRREEQVQHFCVEVQLQ